MIANNHDIQSYIGGYYEQAIIELGRLKSEASRHTRMDYDDITQDYDTRFKQLQAMREKGL